MVSAISHVHSGAFEEVFMVKYLSTQKTNYESSNSGTKRASWVDESVLLLAIHQVGAS